MIQKRPATTAEVAAKVRHGSRQKFRHWLSETITARGIVRHRQYSTAKVEHLDGRVTIASGGYKGERLTGTHCTLPSGSTFVADIRIDSPYLPTNI